jgi:hypothetical protein
MAGSLAAATSRGASCKSLASRPLVRAHRATPSQRTYAAVSYHVATEERAKRLEVLGCIAGSAPEPAPPGAWEPPDA